MNSKQLFYAIFVAALLGSTVTQAQSPTPAAQTPASAAKGTTPTARSGATPKGSVAPKSRGATGIGTRDGLTMKDGRVVLTEFGSTNPLVADKKLNNGTTIGASGLVTATDGTTTQLTEGDLVSLTGRVTSRASIVEADSLLKIKMFDIKYPGKRKKMEDDRERKAKIKLKMEEQKAKSKSKSGRG